MCWDRPWTKGTVGRSVSARGYSAPPCYWHSPMSSYCLSPSIQLVYDTRQRYFRYDSHGDNH